MRYPEFHYRWEWTLNSSPEALWPLVTDTNRFNRETGVPPVEERAAADETLVNARRRLRLVRLGVPLEWNEEPFEWVRPYRFGVARRYLSGPMQEMRVAGEMIPQANGGTRLVYQVWARPKNLLGLLGVPVQVGILNARSFASAFRRADELAAQDERPLALSTESHLSPGGSARLVEVRQTLLARGAPLDLVTRLLETVERADDLTLARMRPYGFADAWHANRRAVLELFLWGTRVGLLDFEWDLLCPLCRGAKATTPTLSQLPAQVHCGVCQIDFAANFEQAVELTFRPNPAIRQVAPRPYCVGGPQVTPHIIAQQLLSPHTRRSLTLPLESGRYRARTLLLHGAQYLNAVAGGAAEISLRAEANGWSDEQSELALQPTLHFENDTDREQLFILERIMWGDQSVTAAEVTTLQTFRDLFSSEALRPGEQISVGTLTIVFTDLRASTQLYESIGDAPAFGHVMNHFDVLREAISAEGGTIVKTIGDAVMAAFRRPVAALRAMLRAQQELASAPASAARLVLKVGIHQGPCIAVTLNERLDYFGTTVNIASRIQNLSVGGDVVISSAIYDDPEVQAWLGNPENQLHLEAFDAKLKGIAAPVRLWRIVRAPTE